MAIDLSNRTSVATALFVKMVVPDYDTLTFSNFNREVDIDNITYLPLGNLLAITESKSDINATEGTMTITITGIPDSSIAEIMNNRIKGSKVSVYRAFFDPLTGDVLNISGNPVGRFFGIVNNYSLDETWNTGTDTSFNTISLICSSTIEILSNKMSGRRTNDRDQQELYPGDLGLSRVTKLANSNFQFGAAIK